MPRRPRNPLGWSFCAIGIASGLTGTGEAYALYTLATAPGALPGGELMSWLGNWAWAPGLGLLITFALLLSPTGGCHRTGGVPWPGCRPPRWPSSAELERPGPGGNAV